MLTASRFTTVPTKDCVNRLEAALSNAQPIARGERHRGAVTALQSALADLNSAYLLVAEVDGYFGSRTSQAVEAFQRDYGLIADAMVGKQTMTQLDNLYSGDIVRRPRGLSIHLGLNKVDADHYGSDYPLGSCVNDARKMHEIAESLGYDPVTFIDEEATCSNLTGFMRRAIADLYAGDSLLITFSGHGSQIPNTTADVEADNMDETLCLFDRMFIDDEFYALLAQFREGVRISAVFDSCHSGSVAKNMWRITKDPFLSAEDLTKSRTNYEKGLIENLKVVVEVEEDYKPIAADSIAKALDGDRPDFVAPPQPKSAEKRDKDIATFFGEIFESGSSGKSKRIDTFKSSNGLVNQIYEQHKDLYDSIKNVVGPLEDQELSCSVITLSACHDSQTTPAGPIYSLFTDNIINVWRLGNFDGSYTQFHRNITDLSPDDVTPEINTYGTNMAKARLYDRPFAF